MVTNNTLDSVISSLAVPMMATPPPRHMDPVQQVVSTHKSDTFVGHDRNRRPINPDLLLYNAKGQVVDDKTPPSAADTRRGSAISGNAKETTDPAAAQYKQAADKAGSNLTEAELEIVAQLEKRDREVRAHERQHAAVGGRYAGAPSFSFEVGPNGKRYAVSGEVSIDVSAIPGEPAATISKMRRVRAAALAPASPSGADQSIAARATQIMMQARANMATGNTDNAEDGGKAEPTRQQAGRVDANNQAGQPSAAPELG